MPLQAAAAALCANARGFRVQWTAGASHQRSGRAIKGTERGRGGRMGALRAQFWTAGIAGELKQCCSIHVGSKV